MPGGRRLRHRGCGLHRTLRGGGRHGDKVGRKVCQGRRILLHQCFPFGLRHSDRPDFLYGHRSLISGGECRQTRSLCGTLHGVIPSILFGRPPRGVVCAPRGFRRIAHETYEYRNSDRAGNCMAVRACPRRSVGKARSRFTGRVRLKHTSALWGRCVFCSPPPGTAGEFRKSFSGE